MAKVTLTFEDTVGGRLDGAVSLVWKCDPTIQIKDGAFVDPTPAQTQAIETLQYLNARYECLDLEHQFESPAETD